MADLQINTDEITAALKANLEGFTPSVEQTTVGRVLEVGDGIARVSGLPNAAVNETAPVKYAILHRVDGSNYAKTGKATVSFFLFSYGQLE